MTWDDFRAVIERRALVPSRIESGGWHCWAYCGACNWRGPRHGGDADKAHEAAKRDLTAHYLTELQCAVKQKAA